MGDLPDSGAGVGVDNYETTLANGGPTHAILADAAEPLYLGGCVDGDDDGHPSTGADGDDTNTSDSTVPVTVGTCTGNDDEDGIQFITPLVPGSQACVRVTASVVSAQISGWLDFNRNGNLEAGEELVNAAVNAGTMVNATTYDHCFTVPTGASNAHQGTLYSRFRLATADVTSPNGSAADGEVEDYRLQLACVGNYLWLDTGATANQQDGTDTAVADGTTVNLVWGGPDGSIATTGDNVSYSTTTSGGKYHFCGLIPATNAYQVVVPTAPANTSLVSADQGGNDALDSDGTAGGGNAAQSPVFTVALPDGATDDASNDTSGTGSGNSGYPDVQDNLTFDFGFAARYDYGDLPETYVTTAQPRHTLSSDLYLGGCVDSEAAGAPTTDANGDDTTAGTSTLGSCTTANDDEDGITLVTPIIPGQTACVEVDAINTTGSNATLQMWFDFNGDGDVMDAGEAVSLTGSGVVANGGVSDVDYCFTVPANASHGSNIAYRARLSTAGGLMGNSGTAANGEIEDYITPLVCVGNYVWLDYGTGTEHLQDADDLPINSATITLTAPNGRTYTMETGDSNGDGVVDGTDNLAYAGKYHFCGIPANVDQSFTLSSSLGDATGLGGIDLTGSTAVTPNQGSNTALDGEASGGVTFNPTTANATQDTANVQQNNYGDDQTNLPTGYTDSSTFFQFDFGYRMTASAVALVESGVANAQYPVMLAVLVMVVATFVVVRRRGETLS